MSYSQAGNPFQKKGNEPRKTTKGKGLSLIHI